MRFAKKSVSTIDAKNNARISASSERRESNFHTVESLYVSSSAVTGAQPART